MFSFVRSRDSDTKVRVQLVDRGDEVVLDTSELLPLNPMFEKIPVFAQRFCLDGYDELVRMKNFEQNTSTFVFLEKFSDDDKKFQTVDFE